ncbi:MAG TPA: pentapeptide repeat-containing protein, partial [Acidobacteriaceae bacterium]|nr:pentapeptide repeat-containing protein [Acidobacteriaceae bacterium]
MILWFVLIIGLFAAHGIEAAEINGCTITSATLCTEMDLRGTNLRGADLARAALRQSNFSGADMREANL